MPRPFRAPAALASLLMALTVCLLASAAEAPKGDGGKNLLKPTNKPESWRFEQNESAKGTIAADGDAIVFEVTAVDGTDWHVQVYQTDLDLKDGKEYVVTFKAKAAAERSVHLNAMIHQEDWHPIGLEENVDLSKDWKDYKYEFKAENTVAKKNRIGFQLGNEKGKVWVKDMSLAEK
jgi:hypothetical protein